MFTEAEKKALANYDRLIREAQRGLDSMDAPVFCNRYGCQIARYALRRREIEWKAFRRSLSELAVAARASGDLM